MTADERDPHERPPHRSGPPVDAPVWDELCALVVDGAVLRESIRRVDHDRLEHFASDEDATLGEILRLGVNEAPLRSVAYLDWSEDGSELVEVARAATLSAHGPLAAAQLDLSAVPDGTLVSDEATSAALVAPLAAVGLELCYVDDGTDQYVVLVVPTANVVAAERRVAALGDDVRLRPLPETRAWDLPALADGVARTGDVSVSDTRSPLPLVLTVVALLATLAGAVPSILRGFVDPERAEIWATALPIAAAILLAGWIAILVHGHRSVRRRRALAAGHPGSFVGTTVVSEAFRDAYGAVAAHLAAPGAPPVSVPKESSELEYVVAPLGLRLVRRGTGGPELVVPRAAVRALGIDRVLLENRTAWTAVVTLLLDGRTVELPLTGRRDAPLPTPFGRRATEQVIDEIGLRWPEHARRSAPGIVVR